GPICAARFEAKYRGKFDSTSASRRSRAERWEFSMATAASEPKAMRNLRSASEKEWVAVRLSTYKMPRTFWSVPMSGVHMALRTLWMRIDLPLKRSSAAVLSDRMATRSSTTFRAIDCGTCFEAEDCTVRPLEMRGTSSPEAASSNRMETRSTFITWNVNSTTLSSSRSRSCCLESSFEISSNNSSFFSRSSSSDLAATFRCDAPDGLAVLAWHPAVDEGAVRVAAGDGGVVDRDVARDRASDDDDTPGLEVDGLLARGAQQLKHRRKISMPVRLR